MYYIHFCEILIGTYRF